MVKPELRDLIRESGVSQAEIARRLGVDRSVVSHCLSEKTEQRIRDALLSILVKQELRNG